VLFVRRVVGAALAVMLVSACTIQGMAGPVAPEPLPTRLQ
jgi:hypothetical protein